jgi:gliding motility-associated-like protein
MSIKYVFLLFFVFIQSLFFSQAGADGTCPTCVQTLTNSNLPAPSVKGNPQIVMNGNETFATSYTETACGLNYISASFNLNQRSFSFGTGVVQPAAFTVSGIPTCGKILKALLYSSCESDGTTVINASITNPLLANSIFPMTVIGTGASKCWSRVSSLAFRADITSIISGNGTYYLSGFPAGPLAGQDDVNGASLFIIYTDESQNYTGSIVIADGMATNVSGNTPTATISGFNVCGPTALTTNFMILDDLQQVGNADIMLNSPIDNYTIPSLTQFPWMLISQPGSPAVNGQTSAVYGTTLTGDCVGVIMAGMYYRTGCLTCPNPLTLTASSASCVPTGTASLLALGGVPPLTYTWQGTAQTTSLVTGLTPGTHTVRVADANSCKSATTSVNIASSMTLVATSASCAPTFTARATATGGTPPYTYAWTGSAATTSFVAGLSPGLHTVTVSDAGACQTRTAVVNIAATMSLAVASASCAPTFTARATATGGVGAYTYAWSGSAQTTSFVTALAPGPYTVTVSDAGACQTRTAVINIAATMSLAVTSASCVPTFTARANASGGFAPYTYTWTGTAQTTSFVTALTPGPYTVTVSDAGACQTRTAALNIVSTLTITPASASCVTTGSANVTSVGGLTPYTYAWTGSAQTTSLVTGLAAGFQTVTVTDAGACQTRTVLVNITRPSTITVANSSLCIGYSQTMTAVGSTSSWTWTPAANLVNPNLQTVTADPLVTTIYTIVNTNSLNCTSTNTAQMVVLPTQTVPIANPTTCVNQNLQLLANVTYTGSIYSWTGPGGYTSSSQNPIRLTANVAMNGSYSLTVISIPGCTSSAVANVTVFTLPTPAIASNGTICTNVTLILNGSGATTYSWTGPPPNNFSSVSQNTTIANTTTLDSGVYTLTAAFANGCANTATRTILIRPLPPTSFTVNGGNPVCLNTTITLNGSGGTSYTWRGPNAFLSFVQNPTINNISAAASGIYTLTATLNTCTFAVTQSVTVNPLPVPTATNDTPTCEQHPIQFSATGGISYTWTGPPTYTNNLQNASIPSSTLANNGVFTVTVADGNNCKARATTTVVILPNPAIVITPTNVCLNEPGTINLTGGVSWAWTGPAGFSSFAQSANVGVVNNTTAGNYSVIVSAANSCTTLAVATLSFIPLPVILTTPTLACFNTVAILSASGAVSYSWAGPSGYQSVGQNAIIPVANVASSGLYTITARGANTCTNLAFATLGTIPLPTVTATGALVCIKNEATLTSVGTPTNVIYHWNGPAGYTSNAQNAIIPSATNALPLSYTVMVTHPNSCTMTAAVTLSTNPQPIVVATPTLICKNEPYVIAASGASSYAWTGPPGNVIGASYSLTTVNGSNVGTYSVIGTDVNTCTNIATAKIDTLSLPVVVAFGSTVCIGRPAILNASGAVAYSWTGPNGYTSTSPSAIIPVTTSSLTQVYSVVGVAPNTCTQIAYVNLDTWPLPQPTFTAPPRVCFKSTMYLLGAGAKTYTWSGPYAYYSPNKNVTIPIYTNFQQGTYTLSVIDSLGCTNFTTTYVKIDQLPTGKLTNNNTNNMCAPFCSEFKLNSTGASSIINTSWIANNRPFTGETFTLCVATATDNIVIGTFTDAIGCINTVSFAIQAHPSPIADYRYSPERPVENSDLVLFDDNTFGEKLVKWDWFFISDKGFLSSNRNTSFLFEDAGSFPVALIVTNTWGCSDTVVKTVVVDSDFKLFVPNSFTPNGDGVNDVFMPKGRGLVKYKLSVYDRWGRLIFESHSFETGWDGQVYDKNSSDDVYVWKINGVDVSGKVKELSGHVTIAR